MNDNGLEVGAVAGTAKKTHTFVLQYYFQTRPKAWPPDWPPNSAVRCELIWNSPNELSLDVCQNLTRRLAV